MTKKVVGHLDSNEMQEFRKLAIAEDMIFIGEDYEDCIDPRKHAESYQAFWEWLFMSNDLEPGKEYVICRYTGTIFEEEPEGDWTTDETELG